MKKIIPALAIAALVLTGCASSPGSSASDEGKSPDYLIEERATLDDGRTVTCVIYSGFKQGGLSCDWGGAK